jgi:DNA-binding MarR family transcriptional regulator
MRIETFLKQSLLFEVNRAARLMERHMSRIFGSGDFHLMEALVLVAIFFEDPRGVKPSQLSEAMSTTRGNISHCVSSLEAKGLIRRRIDADDARSFQLLLKPQGRAQAMQAIRALDRLQREFETNLGTAKLTATCGVVKQAEQICANAAEKS